MNRSAAQTTQPTAKSLTPVQGLLQRKCDCGNHTVAGGECAECGKKSRLQRKLMIGASNDPLEQEADRIADQVLSTPAHSAVIGAAPRIQRFTGQATGEAGTAPASVDRVLASSGRPLEPALQQDMGQRFGYDFSRVRVHTDAAAVQSARDVNAHAYTVGYNIVFGTGRFAPRTHEGRKLLAHELTHVAQQSSGIQGVPTIQRKNGKADVSILVEGECKAPKSIAMAALQGGRMVRAALDWFLSSVPEDEIILNSHLRSNFGSDSPETRTTVHNRLVQVSGYLERAQRGGLPFRCLEAKDPACQKHVAEGIKGENRIYLCPNWFDEFASHGVNYGGYSFIHECSHIAGAVEKKEVYQSKIYGGLTTGECLRHTPAGDPLNNADNYAWFVNCVALPPGAEVFPGLTIEGKVPGKKQSK
jgi:hypothetical protein